MIETVAVVHNELNVGIYRLLSDFFRFCGVSVYNYSVKENTALQWSYEFSAVFIDDTDIQHRLSESQRQCLQDKTEDQGFLWLKSEDTHFNLESGEHRGRIDFLNHVIDMLVGRFQNENAEVLKHLAKFFVERDVMKNRIILQTFLNEPRYIRIVREEFVDAYIALLKCNDKDKWEKNSYFWFAQRYLEQSINESCSFLDEDMLLATKKVIHLIKQQLETYSEHKVHQALLYASIALFSECDFFMQRQSVDAWRTAYGLSRKSPFEPTFAYRLGRCIEKQLGDWDEAIVHYEYALQMMPNDYRTVYKVAVYYWRQKKDIVKACEYFRRIDEILLDRYNNNLMQPREAEYLYKAWRFIRQIIKENNAQPVNDIDAQFAEKRMEQIREKVMDSGSKNPNYTLIFGPDAQIKSRDARLPQVDARTALDDRIRVVCVL